MTGSFLPNIVHRPSQEHRNNIKPIEGESEDNQSNYRGFETNIPHQLTSHNPFHMRRQTMSTSDDIVRHQRNTSRHLWKHEPKMEKTEKITPLGSLGKTLSKHDLFLVLRIDHNRVATPSETIINSTHYLFHNPIVLSFHICDDIEIVPHWSSAIRSHLSF